MSTTLGKRKREVVVATRHRRRSSSDDGDDQHNAIPPETERDIFKKYFESTFEPLPESPTVLPPPSDEDEGEDDDGSDDPSSREDEDWEGLSGSEHEEGPTTVEVVEHWKATNDSEDAEFRRLQYKTFMSSKPPKEVEQTTKKKPKQQPEEEDQSEALNLKHDLDLQRLLKESHLLEEAKASSTLGAHRHKALDMRLQSLGSKGSLFQQEKMPLTHRKGILAKAASREAFRRQEARENGIILERPSGKAKSSQSRRERGVDVPAVGKFRGGTLKLTKKDVVNIQGAGHSGGRGSKGRRR
ncbi:pre-rRNA processing and 40S ribosomal subunit assembly [Exophiala dermatitidis]|uniref:Protein FAF1 n=2 Tax=Exophiala dermatitidis TaxID=5970 RepID=H6BY10_EXODN|nr:uncharacterized protein HMPREF1120_04707 [Exophiala dermatitidis NIH/UT8656]KAJ4520302.1 pre-rRNA processing and 40S ribosomal subunit assembly [Exophiala dermatitidis]EHY56632.1 hypothetical protein HMPREF1120_04707 [Exophiala dermatitidis NIH/UT8656]KAJ4524166.1 pre-rRNA processing and 40S ribosomal subunit assembly [Exophiala dermatitidis]KAJ4525562.1 pre-rRNA processing and 40S ribosomal subunit assembly [Exophiala dermatitidis]KAJ4536879.1 pre-rRNA processing and 40S ribosomal subunit 